MDIPANFTKDLYEYIELMKDFTSFAPRIVSLQCPNCVMDVRERECLSDGLYCLVPPKDEIARHYPMISDRALLIENLRSKCVHIVT